MTEHEGPAGLLIGSQVQLVRRYALFLIILVLLSGSIFSACANPSDSTVHSPGAPPPATPVITPDKADKPTPLPVVSSMEATVVKKDPERITVKAADGTIYTFGVVLEDISAPSEYLNAGFALTISFYGELDPALPLQNAVISHIGVTEKQENENALLLRAIDILRGMDMKSKVGQLFFIPCPGSLAAQTAEEYRPGGYILFSKDFEGKTKEQVSADIGSYQASSAIPLFIGVDEEGGTVNRVSWFPEMRDEPFLSPRKLFELGGFELITEDAGEKSELLSSLGINVNLAPVADLSDNPESFIYKRSFGDDAEQVSDYIRSVVSVMCDKNMGSVLKHFPGYGDNPDTHDLAAYDNRAYDVFLSNDFLPFRAGIESGADAVMVSHNIVSCMDENHPASLSPEVHRILREELNFRGVIMTDDLAMGAVAAFTEGEDAAVLAICAGADILCTANYKEQIPAVIRAVNEKAISEERIDASVLRILLWKLKCKII